MTYVDGFVIPIKKKNLKAYKKMAELGSKVWRKHGALEYFECVGDDLHPKVDVPGFSMTPFTKMAKAKSDETVLFSYIVFKSKAHRNAVNKKVMQDPAMTNPKNKNMVMPFDPSRMAYGGFKTIVKK